VSGAGEARHLLDPQRADEAPFRFEPRTWTLAELYEACGPPPRRPLSDDWMLGRWGWWSGSDTKRARRQDRNPDRRHAALELASRRAWLHVRTQPPRAPEARVEDESTWQAEAAESGVERGVEPCAADNPELLVITSDHERERRAWIPKPPLPDLERRTQVYRQAELTKTQMVVFDMRVRGFHFEPLAAALNRTLRALRYRSEGAIRTLSSRAWFFQAPNLPGHPISRGRCCYGGHVPFVLLDVKQYPPPTRFFCAHSQFWVDDLAATEQTAINGIHHADHISEETQAQ
jgi:hypothetical protein